jgi:hypothetical protein
MTTKAKDIAEAGTWLLMADRWRAVAARALVDLRGIGREAQGVRIGITVLGRQFDLVYDPTDLDRLLRIGQSGLDAWCDRLRALVRQ